MTTRHTLSFSNFQEERKSTRVANPGLDHGLKSGALTPLLGSRAPEDPGGAGLSARAAPHARSRRFVPEKNVVLILFDFTFFARVPRQPPSF